MSLLGTHLTGAPLTLQAAFDPAYYFAALDASGARTASIVPALLADLLEVGPDWPDGLEYLITAAAPLTSDLARRFHRRYGARLRQGYGLTEAVNFSFTTPRLDDSEFRAQYLERTPPVGAPLPDTELRLESGEVWIRTPDLMTGYWQDSHTTAAAVTDDGWLRTGDLGELRDGLLVLRGRAGERINRGGEKHYPLDLEHGWRGAGLSGRFAAVAVDEPALGQDIGLVATEQPVSTVRALYERAPLRPSAVQFGGFLATPTGKPRRAAMSRGLAARRLRLPHDTNGCWATPRPPRTTCCARGPSTPACARWRRGRGTAAHGQTVKSSSAPWTSCGSTGTTRTMRNCPGPRPAGTGRSSPSGPWQCTRNWPRTWRPATDSRHPPCRWAPRPTSGTARCWCSPTGPRPTARCGRWARCCPFWTVPPGVAGRIAGRG